MTLLSSQPPLRSNAEVRSPADEQSARGPAIPLIRSKDLFVRGREVLIEHDGCHYRLRLTHSNKLILTK